MKRQIAALIVGLVALSGIMPVLAAENRSLGEEIDRRAARLEPALIATRRDLHQHPELSNREVRTANLVAERLRKLGLEVKTGIAGHGVIGVLKGGQPGGVVAVRADMDALPIQEANDVPYRSLTPGVMHACGHDVHTAVQLGVAELLAGLRERIPGTIKFIFQPAEEGAPEGEEGGAKVMIREGALDQPRPAAIFGLHTQPLLAAGKIGYQSGPAMASYDGFEIVVRGKKAHGSAPQDGVDAILVGAQIVNNLQSLVSRMNDTREPLVVSVGIFQAGNRANILADTARLVGTVRCLSPAVRSKVPGWMDQIVKGLTQAYGATYELKYRQELLPVINDSDLVRRTLPIMQHVVGKENVVNSPPVMGSEDFSYYQQQLPGFFYFLGVRNEERGIIHGWHTEHFDVDERCLGIGIRTMAHVLVDYLENNH